MATRFTHAIVAKIIRENKPRGWKVLERESERLDPIDGSRDTDGKCHFEEKVISVRPIVSLYMLHVFLHEIAHAKFHTRPSTLELHQEEYEAEIWAFRVMRQYGFRIPRELREEARRNVRVRLEQDDLAGLPINPRVHRWVRYASQGAQGVL